METLEFERQRDEILVTAKRARAASYERFMRDLSAKLKSDRPEHKEAVARKNAALTRHKFIGTNAVHVDATLSTLSVQYKNGEYIGEEIMPVAPVGKMSGKYFKYDKRNRLAYPDDSIGVRGDAPEVSESRSLDNYSCDDHGLMSFVDAQVLANQDAPLDEMVDLTESIAEGGAFNREVRIAAIATDATQYPTGNKVTIAAAQQWDSAGGGNPIKVLQDARASLWHGRGPGIIRAWSSLEVFNVLSRHPMILDLFKYGGTAPGLATPKMIASFFGFDDYVVSEARKDTANVGQTESYSRIWGKFFGLARVATRPTIRNAAFGYTMRFGAITTDTWFDVKKGKQGAYYARNSNSEDYKVVAADTSYLISTPIS